MARTSVLAAGLAVLIAIAAGAAGWVASSQAAPHAVTAVEVQRTFVSTAGSDTNPCTAAAPCRNFATAIANTLAGGEVVALESGGYGAFTIGKAITIAGSPGKHVAVTAFAGTAVHVLAGANDAVVLRNLYLNGLGADTGIDFEGGSTLHVDAVTATGFLGNGFVTDIDGARVLIANSHFRRNGIDGIHVDGDVHVEIADSTASRNNSSGFHFLGGADGSIVRARASHNGVSGFRVRFSGPFAISDSTADGNSAGVHGGGGGTNVTVTACELGNNGNGLEVAVAGAVVRISGSTAVGNTVGLANLSGTLESYGDNLVGGNLNATSGTITPVAKA